MTDIDITIEKIEKAVRLANKTDELGERETALRIARRLAESKGIVFEEVIVESQEVKTKREEDDDYTPWHGVVSGWAIITIRNHFGVVVMTYKRKSDKGKKARLCWFGSSINIDIAKYAYDILVRECERAWRKVKKMNGGKMKKDLFVRGWYFAIDRKLTEHHLRNDAEQFAAERADAERKFKEATEQESIKEKKIRNSREDDGTALTLGYQMGSEISLNRPCGNCNKSFTEIGETKLLKGVA